MQHGTVDGNEAAAAVAYRASEVVAIYPITPASPMGELADAWASVGKPNRWGAVPSVVEMQSEGGAAGALHGAIQAGALGTTFTASQGLLLMIPNMYKIAGELTPTVIHVAARTVATHALSIFGDHSDVMATRATGWAMLAASSVQEAQDLALVAHAATLESRIPFLHFFDGFRTSHEVSKIELLDPSVIDQFLTDDVVTAHRLRSLDPNRPVLRGTAQNPDVFFQAREAVNGHYAATPDMVTGVMDRLAAATGRQYHLFDYWGSPNADRVIVMMGSGVGPAKEAVASMVDAGKDVGIIAVRLYRPFSVSAFADALPGSVRRIAVLDRTKEPGSVGEPLYTDVVAALAETGRPVDHVLGGRYGLSSKEFTPAQVMAVFDELDRPEPRRHFTVGIVDDISGLSLDVDESTWVEPEETRRAVFFGLGSDGTVGANKNTVKIIGEETDLFAQGYFVYDSKKSGSITTSHLRFGPRPIDSTYLVRDADFVGCHQFGLLERVDVLSRARAGATVLLNSPYGPDDVWERLPVSARNAIVDLGIDLWVIDAHRIARDAGMPGRVNTVLQVCFFTLSNVIPLDTAMSAIETSIRKTYGKRGDAVVRRNLEAVSAARDGLHRVSVPETTTQPVAPPAELPADPFERLIHQIISGDGDLLPVSAMPIDGTFPTGTAKWEKRSIGDEIPIWDPEICIDCARCTLVCPHAAIRMKVVPAESLSDAPDGFRSKEWSGKDFAGQHMALQVAPDDCTGCGVCVSVCPAKSKESVRHKAINMEQKLGYLDLERRSFDFFLGLPEADRTAVRANTVVGSQALEPLFEFSGACAGCGETPYLKLLTQLFGDRIIVANATGCSSIYGGNLPTTPWSKNSDGRGPAWSNSLFEDNAEFGLGMRLALDAKRRAAASLLEALRADLGDDAFVEELLRSDQSQESGIAEQRARVERLREQLAAIERPEARRLEAVADALVDTGVWIIGGDGWAHDIGFGGLDHVLATGRNVNVLVLDTEVYSNTGGQASKATPRAAVAKFAAAGKPTAKKDLGMIAMQYGNVYVAQIAMGANMTQSVKAFSEAEAHPGPSLLIAYSPCIAHGIDMATMMDQQKAASESGYWPLYRFDPAREGGHSFHLDSRKPKIPFSEFAEKEARFAMLAAAAPDRASELMAAAQRDIDDRWHYYEQAEDIEWVAADSESEEPG